MGVFFAVLLILAALILLYILWCLAEPFFLVNDKVSLKRTELTDGEISKETVKKLPFVPNGSESSPDLRIFFFSDIHTEWCPVTAKRLCKSIIYIKCKPHFHIFVRVPFAIFCKI